MKNGKYRIKRYKVKRGKGLLWILFALAAAAAALFILNGRHILTLPAFTAPALSAEEMQQQTRVITLPGGQWFSLQLGAFEEEKSAQALADTYRGRGAAGYLYANGTFRVLAAAYENRESARAVQAQLARKHGVDAYLYSLTRSEVTLRIHGQQAQLNALEDALSLCDQLTYTLSGLSEALDKGEIPAEEATRALSSQKDTVRALNSRLTVLFAKEDHPAVSRLSSLLTQTEEALNNALNAPNATRLGSGIKYAQLQIICGLEAYVQALNP